MSNYNTSNLKREITKMKKYRMVAILGLVFFLLVCSKSKNPVNPVEESPGFLFESFQSECGDGSKIGTSGGTEGNSVIFNVHGDTIEVIHRDAYYQCCAMIEVDVIQNENGFDIDFTPNGEGACRVTKAE